MEFISTRGSAEPLEAGGAILTGMAKDGGLYVPSSFPTLSKVDFEAMKGMSYAERAVFVLSKYLTDYPEDELKEMCEKAYAKFDGDPAPLVKVDDGTFLLELWHGPTLAFKDMALTLLPYLMSSARKRAHSDKKTLILVATSGDTGKAALEGFADVEGTEIVVVYPSEGVSPMQKLQMQTARGNNVHVLGIDGNFDDAQTAVKTIFKDPDSVARLAEKGYELSSANSINWGRLAPQIVYYVSAYVDLLAAAELTDEEQVNFVVPTGNFGNILAAYYAKQMGVPIFQLLPASNRNNVLTDFFNTGKYDVNRAFHKTMSPSMDILISSNLERLLFEVGERDPEYVKQLMEDLDVYGSYEVDYDVLSDNFSEFMGYYSDEDDTAEAIDNFYDMFDYVLDPHTAVAVSAYYNYVTETGDETKTVVVSTANPYKFAKDVYRVLSGKKEDDAFRAVEKLSNYTVTDIPKPIAELKELPVLHDKVIPQKAIKEEILGIFGA